MNENELKDSFDELRRAQPRWVAEGLGVRGNAIQFHKEQTQVDWPGVTLTRHAARNLTPTINSAGAGAPEQDSAVLPQ